MVAATIARSRAIARGGIGRHAPDEHHVRARLQGGQGKLNVGAKTDAAGDDVAEYVTTSLSIVAPRFPARPPPGGRIVTTTRYVPRRCAAPRARLRREPGGARVHGPNSPACCSPRSDDDAATGGTQATTIVDRDHGARSRARCTRDVVLAAAAGRSLASVRRLAPGARRSMYDATSGAVPANRARTPPRDTSDGIGVRGT